MFRCSTSDLNLFSSQSDFCPFMAFSCDNRYLKKTIHTSSNKSIGSYSRGGEASDGRHNGGHADNHTGKNWKLNKSLQWEKCNRTKSHQSERRVKSKTQTWRQTPAIISVTWHFVATFLIKVESQWLLGGGGYWLFNINLSVNISLVLLLVNLSADIRICQVSAGCPFSNHGDKGESKQENLIILAFRNSLANFSFRSARFNFNISFSKFMKRVFTSHTAFL